VNRRTYDVEFRKGLIIDIQRTVFHDVDLGTFENFYTGDFFLDFINLGHLFEKFFLIRTIRYCKCFSMIGDQNILVPEALCRFNTILNGISAIRPVGM